MRKCPTGRFIHSFLEKVELFLKNLAVAGWMAVKAQRWYNRVVKGDWEFNR